AGRPYAGRVTDRKRQRLRQWGLVPLRIAGEWYLMPLATEPMVTDLSESRDPLTAACVLHDWLTERGITVPLPVQAVLGHARTSDKRAAVDRLLSDPGTAVLSNRELARLAGCSEAYVRGRRRAHLSAHGAQIPAGITVRRGRSTYQMRRRSAT